MASTSKIERLEIKTSEINYFLDTVFLMLVDKDCVQPYDANTEANAQTSAKCVKVKARNVIKLCYHLISLTCDNLPKHGFQLGIETPWFIIACSFLMVSAFTHYYLITILTNFRWNKQAKFS